MADTTIWAQLEPELNRVRLFYEGARGSMSVADLPEQTMLNINTQFTFVAKQIARLSASGDLGRAVIDGKDGASTTWAKVCNEQGRALADIMGQAKDNDLYRRFWDEVVVQTFEDGHQVVVKAAEAAPSVVGAVIVVLVLLIILKVV